MQPQNARKQILKKNSGSELSQGPHVPLLVEIKTEASKDEGKERHKDGDGNGAAVGGAVGFGVSESNIFSHTQTWRKKNTLHSSGGYAEQPVCSRLYVN